MFIIRSVFMRCCLAGSALSATFCSALAASGVPSPYKYFDDIKAALLADAAINGDTGEIDRLIHNGVDPNTLSKDGAPILAWAYLAGSRYGFEELLNQHANPGIQIMRQGETYWFNQLLTHGLSANFVVEGKQTLIYPVISYGRDDLLALLIAHGADVNRRISQNNTPLITTVFGGYHLKATLALLKAGAGYTSGDEFEKGFFDYLDEVGARVGRRQPIWRSDSGVAKYPPTAEPIVRIRARPWRHLRDDRHRHWREFRGGTVGRPLACTLSVQEDRVSAGCGMMRDARPALRSHEPATTR
jgi:hypothetical protein